MEIIIKNRLVNYLDKFQILHYSQYGFRSGRSTIDAVTKLVGDIVGGLEDSRSTSVTLFDLSKAFDCVSHETLLIKLEHYGIRGLSLDFFTSYLSHRYQSVHLNGGSSDWSLIKHGVPQGSVLGPVLFIIYVNDIFSYMHPFKCLLFADDCI